MAARSGGITALGVAPGAGRSHKPTQAGSTPAPPTTFLPMRRIILAALRTARQAALEMVLSDGRPVRFEWPRDITDAELESVLTCFMAEVRVDRELRGETKCTCGSCSKDTVH